MKKEVQNFHQQRVDEVEEKVEEKIDDRISLRRLITRLKILI